MSNWYYADRDRHRHGPMEAEALAQRFRDGRIGLDVLVWRDGMAQWQPLTALAGELGLLAEAPPVTPAPPPGPAPASASAVEAATGNRAVFIASAPATQTWAASTPGYSTPQNGADRSPYPAPAAAQTSRGDVVLGGEVVYAGFWKRLAAYLLDAVVIGVVTQIIQMVLTSVFMGVNYGSLLGNPAGLMSSDAGVIMLLAVSLLPLALQLAYYAGMHSSPTQATLGKMAVGIKVTDEHGQRIGLGRAIARYFAMILSTLILFVGFLMAGFTQRKQALHDILCGTLVVDRWAFTDQPERQRRELGTAAIAILVVSGALLLLGMALAAMVAAALASGGFGQ